MSAPSFSGWIRYGVATVLSTINGTSCLCATSATAWISVTSSLGFPIVSAKISLVFSVISASKASGLFSLTYFTEIPKGFRSSNSSTVPPYSPQAATISSPACRMFRNALVSAAIPEAHATLPIPSSSIVTLFSKDSTVGLLILV